MSLKRLSLSAILFMLVLEHIRAAELYVAPSGHNANPGTREKPFATIAAARDAIRKWKRDGLKENIKVIIGGGVYRIKAPLVFDIRDGGTPQWSVTYAAAEGEQPVISGGIPIDGWKAKEDGTWSATIPEAAKGKLDFRELYVNGRRAQRARHPNRGFLRVESVGIDRRTLFRYRVGDVANYPDIRNVELVFLHDWSITRVPIKSVDAASRTLRVTHQVGGPATWAAMGQFERHPRYFLENSSTFLDTPGEWFLNRASGVLTYRPRPGEERKTVQVEAPIASQLLVVSGDAGKNLPVCNLHFRGLALQHAAWFPTGGVYWGRQACTYWTPKPPRPNQPHQEADPAAVQFELAQSCSFTKGRVEHVGGSAVWFGRGCRDCRVSNNVVSDIGGNGVMIGEGQARRVGRRAWWEAAPEQAASNNLISDNLVERCGQQLFGAVGIWSGLASNTTIANNEVRDHPYSGISVGWMWWESFASAEPRETPCRQTMVVDNDIHHTMRILSDGGGIYVLGLHPDSALRGNVIHDIAGNAGRAESNGMFLDQGAGGFVIEGNVVFNVPRSPLRFHQAWKNLVRNNVLETGSNIPPIRYNATVVERIQQESNTIVQKISEHEIEKAIRRVGRRSPRHQ